jgi:16S rRNA (uracil1498-N3)-methyltransferase
MNRFFLAPENWNMERPRLDSAESHHAADVMRLEEGARLVVFDGLGREAMASVVAVERDGVVLERGAASMQAPLPCRIILGQAIPKGKNMDLIIQKAVELGVSRVVPLLSERTVVRLERPDREKKRVKWAEIAMGACKQCGQNFLPAIDEPVTLAEFFSAGGLPGLLLVASLQPGARSFKEIFQAIRGERGGNPQSVLILIGPEGDFTPAEIGLARSSGCQPVTLGPIILRSETAAIYSLSVLAHELFAGGLSGTR